MADSVKTDRGAACGLDAVVLAAGKGTRMRSDLPKVMHEVAGRPMVQHVVDVCREAGCGRVVVVVGFRQDLVRGQLQGQRGVSFAVQDEQLGTGHAVRCAAGAFSGDAMGRDVLVLCGDGPLIRTETVRALVERHRESGAAATLATSVIDDPSGYGRIVRDRQGAFVGIVEEKNASAEQISIREVNPSYYCFRASALFGALERVERNERTGEYYVTDVPSLLMRGGERVEVIDAVPPEDVLSINTPEQLAVVDGILRDRMASVDGGGAS